MATKIFKIKNPSFYKAPKGLSKKIVEEISYLKKEPSWMRDFRLKSLEIFLRKPMPSWGPNLSEIDFKKIRYFVKSAEKQEKEWKNVALSIKKTFDKLGIPKAEKEIFAGTGAQYDSETVYHNLKKILEEKGVIYMDTDSALKKYPEIFKRYFGKLIAPSDNKFAALNSAFWSGGSFVYIPKGVKAEIPLQAYFRINSKSMGQFERTLIVAEEGSSVEYLEACSAPIYSSASLHAAVVEIFVKKGAKVKYTTVQNWSNNVYNLVTKRAQVEKEGKMVWLDGNLGSRITMKYPSGILIGKGASVEIFSFAYAGKNQIQDAGGKAIHLAPHTNSRIISKSISQKGGKTIFRARAKITKGARGSKTYLRCDSLILDGKSRAEALPNLDIDEYDSSSSHEAVVGKIGQDKLFYLRSRGFSEKEAMAMVAGGFFEPIIKKLPLEYGLELNRLMEIEITGH